MEISFKYYLNLSRIIAKLIKNMKDGNMTSIKIHFQLTKK